MLKLMTSNIRFDNEFDKENAWPHRKDFLSQVIQDFDPCILGTQEGREPQLRELENLLPHWKMLDHHRDWIEERMYPTLFFKETKMELKDSGDIWLSETPNIPGSKSFESAFPRLCTWMKVQHKEFQKEFLIVNCHLDHVLQSTRKSQAGVLKNEINKVNQDELPLVIMGDFNDAPDSPVREVFHCSSLKVNDPWLDLEKEEETSYHKFKGENEDGSRIDWFLVNEQLKSKEVDLVKEHKEGRYPSDHFPVKLIIEW